MGIDAPQLETRVNPHSGKRGRIQYRVGSKGKYFDTEAEAIRQYNRHNPNNPFTHADQSRLSNGLTGGASATTNQKPIHEIPGQQAAKETKAVSKIGKFFKGGGKAALTGVAVGVAIVAVGAGIAALLKGCSDDKEKPAAVTNPDKTNTNPKPPVTAPTDTTETEQPVEETLAPTTPEEPEEPAEPEYDTFKAIPGSWQWRFAERELLLEHQGEPDYKPTPAEIDARSREIVARDERKMADDDIHTDPMLKQGDDVTITKPLADLCKEARQQLIEDHKDQKGYEPTWKEITKIVDEKIKEAKAEKPAA